MNLLSELQAEVQAVYAGRCPVRKWLLSLDDDTRLQAEQVIDSDVPAPRVAAFLSKRFPGLEFDDKPIQSHRRSIRGRAGGCKCLPS